MGFERIVERIQTLPPLPESVLRLDEAFRKGDPDVKTIVSIIEKDPLLTANILARVNAPSYGLRNRIVSVMQAVTLFGLGTVRAFALKAAIEQNFDIDMSPYGISNEKFGKISLMQNALMFQWYMGIDVEKAKLLIPLAFLMEMGKVLIAKEVTESSYADYFCDALKADDKVENIESEFAGTTSEQIGALLFRHWHFEEAFSIIMESMTDMDRSPVVMKEMVLALKAVQSAINVKEQCSDESIINGLEYVRKGGWDEHRFIHAAHRIREKFA